MFPGFSSLIGLIIRVGLLVRGIHLIIGGIEQRKNTRLYGGIGLCLFLAYWQYSLPNTDKVDDWNPTVSRQKIVGKWYYGKGILILDSDSTYRCAGFPEALRARGVYDTTGLWKLSGSHLNLYGFNKAVEQELSVVAYKGELRLTRIEDPDTWDNDVDFTRVPTANVTEE